MSNPIVRAALAACLALVSIVPAAAQRRAALVPPGEAVPVPLLEAEGGPVGRVVAPLVGKAPVLAVYWRPGDPLSEEALVRAAAMVQEVTTRIHFFPVAVLAARQSPEAVRTRLRAMGMSGFPALVDGGQFARIVGVRSIPSFVLVDAGGVLRVVGGSDITQVGPGGVSIAEAMARAATGKPVPTLGVLPTRQVFRLLRKKLPALAGTKLDGKTWVKLTDYVDGEHWVLVVFWSPICPHCVKMLPELRLWLENHPREDLRVVDISRGDAPALRKGARDFIAGYPFEHVLDVDRQISRGLRVHETPALFLVAPDGTVKAVQAGGSVDIKEWLATELPRARAATGKAANR